MSNLKRTITITEFKFMKEEFKKDYIDEMHEIRKELNKNKDIVESYPGNELINCTKVAAKHSKVAMCMFKMIYFNIVISDSDWESLIYVLKKKDNKVFGLDFSKPDLSSYFNKFLEIMGSKHLYL